MSRRFGSDSRPYAKTHPWIKFAFNLHDLTQLDFTRLGEALAKSDQIAHVPLLPEVAEELHHIFLVKGIHATTQIEGNSLSEEEVRARVDGELKLPESQEYLGKEIDNILAACNLLGAELASGADMRLTRTRIEEFNEMVLNGLPKEEGVTPGKIRTKSVVVGGVYRGAPAEDCGFLLDQLCAWLDQLPKDAGPDWSRPMKLIRAMLAHLYLAWIHPFGDGNGRTARLVEFQLLLEAGYPTPAGHLLSNYYNRTRQMYYQVLQETSQRPPYPAWKFVSYALRGLVEEMDKQLTLIQASQLKMAWINFVHENLGGSTPTAKRRRDLVLQLPDDHMTPISSIPRLTVDLAAYYAGKTNKTITRDINALAKAGLLVKAGSRVRPATDRMLAFLPMCNEAPSERASA